MARKRTGPAVEARARKVNATGKIVELDRLKIFLPDKPSEMGTKELIRGLSGR